MRLTTQDIVKLELSTKAQREGSKKHKMALRRIAYFKIYIPRAIRPDCNAVQSIKRTRYGDNIV